MLVQSAIYFLQSIFTSKNHETTFNRSEQLLVISAYMHLISLRECEILQQDVEVFSEQSPTFNVLYVQSESIEEHN